MRQIYVLLAVTVITLSMVGVVHASMVKSIPTVNVPLYVASVTASYTFGSSSPPTSLSAYIPGTIYLGAYDNGYYYAELNFTVTIINNTASLKTATVTVTCPSPLGTQSASIPAPAAGSTASVTIKFTPNIQGSVTSSGFLTCSISANTGIYAVSVASPIMFSTWGVDVYTGKYVPAFNVSFASPYFYTTTNVLPSLSIVPFGGATVDSSLFLVNTGSSGSDTSSFTLPAPTTAGQSYMLQFDVISQSAVGDAPDFVPGSLNTIAGVGLKPTLNALDALHTILYYPMLFIFVHNVPSVNPYVAVFSTNATLKPVSFKSIYGYSISSLSVVSVNPGQAYVVTSPGKYYVYAFVVNSTISHLPIPQLLFINAVQLSPVINNVIKGNYTLVNATLVTGLSQLSTGDINYTALVGFPFGSAYSTTPLTVSIVYNPSGAYSTYNYASNILVFTNYTKPVMRFITGLQYSYVDVMSLKLSQFTVKYLASVPPASLYSGFSGSVNTYVPTIVMPTVQIISLNTTTVVFNVLTYLTANTIFNPRTSDVVAMVSNNNVTLATLYPTVAQASTAYSINLATGYTVQYPSLGLMSGNLAAYINLPPSLYNSTFAILYPVNKSLTLMTASTSSSVVKNGYTYAFVYPRFIEYITYGNEVVLAYGTVYRVYATYNGKPQSNIEVIIANSAGGNISAFTSPSGYAYLDTVNPWSSTSVTLTILYQSPNGPVEFSYNVPATNDTWINVTLPYPSVVVSTSTTTTSTTTTTTTSTTTTSTTTTSTSTTVPSVKFSLSNSMIIGIIVVVLIIGVAVVVGLRQRSKSSGRYIDI